jgi:hypothetical protein
MSTKHKETTKKLGSELGLVVVKRLLFWLRFAIFGKTAFVLAKFAIFVFFESFSKHYTYAYRGAIVNHVTHPFSGM